MDSEKHSFPGQLAPVILVDMKGIAYLVVAPPSSCPREPHGHRRHCTAHVLDQSCTPSRNHSKLTHVVSEIKKRATIDSPDAVKRQKIAFLETDSQAHIETSIFERKTQLEKSAEQRAEAVFKQWNVQKKTLEQAIDESFR